MAGVGSEEMCDSDQADILMRVRHLSGEGGPITDIYNTNQTVRLHFGIPQNQDPVTQSLQSLSFDNKECEAPTSTQRPPPGFSTVKLETNSNPQNSNKLIIPSLHGGLSSSSSSVSGSSWQGVGVRGSLLGSGTSISSQKPSGLTLSNLASSHLGSTGSQGSLSLSGIPSDNKPSLSNLASSHLGTTGSHGSLSGMLGTSTSSLKPSGLTLSNLASSHLGTTGSQNSLSGMPQDSKPSLSNLASSHLGSSGGQGSAFRIPSLFGKKTEGSDSATGSNSDQLEINLMSALKLSSGPDIKEQKDESRTSTEDEHVLDINILVPQNGFDSIKSLLRKRTKTPFSFALTRKWKRKKTKPDLEIKSFPDHKIEIFRFDSPSPDDVVLYAQKQSRAFNR